MTDKGKKKVDISKWSRTDKSIYIATERCIDGYSADRYENWSGVAMALLKHFNEEQTEAIMMSKWARYAADMSPAAYGHVPAKALVQYALKHADIIDYLVREHFKR